MRAVVLGAAVLALLGEVDAKPKTTKKTPASSASRDGKPAADPGAKTATKSPSKSPVPAAGDAKPTPSSTKSGDGKPTADGGSKAPTASKSDGKRTADPGAKTTSKSPSSSKDTTASKPSSSKSTATKSTATKPSPKKTTSKVTAKKSTSKQRRKKSTSTSTSSAVAVPDVTKTPAYRYGVLSDSDCITELTARKIAFTREATTRGVRSPVRLTGPLRGVTFKTDLPDKQRATTPWEIGDCRLILAMDDFAQILAPKDIVTVVHYSMYRTPPKGDGDKQGTRHPGALALDAARFITKTGTIYDVDKHWNGKIDAPTCGPSAAPNPVTAEATAIRAILCETVDQKLFNVVLTPNYNKPHKNHFHLEVTAGVKWFLVH